MLREQLAALEAKFLESSRQEASFREKIGAAEAEISQKQQKLSEMKRTLAKDRLRLVELQAEAAK